MRPSRPSGSPQRPWRFQLRRLTRSTSNASRPISATAAGPTDVRERCHDQEGLRAQPRRCRSPVDLHSAAGRGQLSDLFDSADRSRPPDWASSSGHGLTCATVSRILPGGHACHRRCKPGPLILRRRWRRQLDSLKTRPSFLTWPWSEQPSRRPARGTWARISRARPKVILPYLRGRNYRMQREESAADGYRGFDRQTVGAAV